MINVSAMERHAPTSTIYRLALPCYENRVLPRFGMARSFVFADIDRDKKQITAITARAWEPLEIADLPTWLRHCHVDGVLCCGIHPRFQIAIEAKGMWVTWGFRGEIEEVLERWLRTGVRRDNRGHGGNFVSCCRIPTDTAGPLLNGPDCKRRKKP